jgi:hypothetical protein
MSDEQNHNDPLERLFRKKSEEYNISYREEDWLNLEKQLDAHDMKLYYQRRLRWLAVASILILSLIGFYTFQNHNKINELTAQLNQSEQVQQDDQADVVDESERSVSPNESETAGQVQQQNASVNNNSESFVTVSEDETQTDQAEILPSRAFAEASQAIRQRPIQPNELFPNRSSVLVSVGSEDQVHPVEVRRASNVSFSSNSRGSNISSSAMVNGPLAGQNAFDTSGNIYSTKSNLAVGIVMSPDLSTVGGVSNFDQPGFKGGVMAEYAFNKTFSLISGLAISNVKYKADGREYNPPQGWNYGVMPDQTMAVCLVLDIPISLKANLFNFDRSRIFATTGLSSYIMLNEDYQFRYNDGNQAGLESSWSESTGTRHWFSNAGFSVGIEYDLSPTWSIRAEPHLKVPLKGVGWGNVDLYSMGSFVSLNYRFGSF